MLVLVWFAVFCLQATFCFHTPHPSSIKSNAGFYHGDDVTVQTPYGAIVGMTDGAGVSRFAAIPYAEPPVDARRFEAAALWNRTFPHGILDGRSLGAPCIQTPIGNPVLDGPEPSEDCLFINIWTPNTSSSQKTIQQNRPVMVWIFGGGLCIGTANSKWFNGSEMVRQHDVVVVTVSYRLGALGFLVTDDPAAPGNGGMNGIHDIIIALRFLNTIIPSFGGDPSLVTLFGQSSGGYAVCSLLTSPPAQSLFHRAIIQSGPCVGGWGPHNVSFGRQITEQVLVQQGVGSVDELKRFPAESIQWPNYLLTDPNVAPYFSGYFFDQGGVLTQMPWDSFVNNQINVLAEGLMIGFTSKDGTASFYGTAPTLPHTSPNDYSTSMDQVWGPHAASVLAQYPLSSFTDSPQSAFIQADADCYVICPLLRIASSLASHNTSSCPNSALLGPFVFEFAHWTSHGCDAGVELNVTKADENNVTAGWASHGADVAKVFGTQAGPGPVSNIQVECPFSQSEQDLSNAMMTAWVSFARCGDPNGCATRTSSSTATTKTKARLLPKWERFCGAGVGRRGSGCTELVMRLAVDADGAASALVTNPHKMACLFWDAQN